MNHSGFLLFAFLTISILIANADHVRVKGKFICPSDASKAKNIRVRIVDKDTANDDKIAEGRTDNSGNFDIQGTGSDLFGKIDPQLKVYHNCGATTSICERRHRFKIPKSYIDKGNSGSSVFDIGSFNLEMEPKEDDTKCSLFG